MASKMVWQTGPKKGVAKGTAIGGAGGRTPAKKGAEERQTPEKREVKVGKREYTKKGEWKKKEVGRPLWSNKGAGEWTHPK